MYVLRCLLPLLVSVLMTHSWPFYANEIPNGANIPDPCQIGEEEASKMQHIWPGVGHNEKQGGGPRNHFGQDFAEMANHKWTVDLCMHDSDQDGVPNGVELGDPDCRWNKGDTPSITDRKLLGHPGICDVKRSINCLDDPDFKLICGSLNHLLSTINSTAVSTLEPRLPGEECTGRLCLNNNRNSFATENTKRKQNVTAPKIETEHRGHDTRTPEDHVILIIIFSGVACLALMLLVTIGGLVRSLMTSRPKAEQQADLPELKTFTNVSLAGKAAADPV